MSEPRRSAGDRSEQLCRVLTAVSGVPVTPGNRVRLLHNGDEIFPAMLAAIDDAERSIDLLTYVYWAGEIGTRWSTKVGIRRSMPWMNRTSCRRRVASSGIVTLSSGDRAVGQMPA